MEKYYDISEENSLNSMEGLSEQDSIKIESEKLHNIDTSDTECLKNILKIQKSNLGDDAFVSRHDPLGVIEWDKDKYSNHFYPESELSKGEEYTYRAKESGNDFKTGHEIVLGDILKYIRDNKIKVLNATVLAYLLNNQEEIPREWKDKRILFLGTEFVGSYTIATGYRPKNSVPVGYARDKFGDPNGFTKHEVWRGSVCALFYRDEVRYEAGKEVKNNSRWDVVPIDKDSLIDLTRGDSIVYLAEDN